MQQTEIHSLLNPYFDGELDYSESLIFEEHLTHCSDCSQALEEQKKLRVILTQSSLEYSAPKKLRRKILSLPNKKKESSRVSLEWNWRTYGIAASIAIAMLAVWIFLPKNSHNEDSAIVNELVSSHVRSLMASPSHLFDIASSDQHTVKPWFAGKLDFSPVVKDFPVQGFQLIGGRLDYIGGKPVAALIYQHQKHLINVFQWSILPDPNEKRAVEQDRGFNLISDESGGIRIWLISDLNTQELSGLADLLK